MHILITGGAGFIGTHLTRHLLSQGQQITVIDNFLPQVHAGGTFLAADIAPHVRLIQGDVADTSRLLGALEGIDCVIHLAAETGTGQSMYEVSRYERTNVGGTAALYELLAKNPGNHVERIIVASSRAVYGEGAYSCVQDGLVYPLARSAEDKHSGHFDPLCPKCDGPCVAVPTPEKAPLQPLSFYGLTKQMQEQIALMFYNVLGIPSIVLRYQNVYGPGQSLSNPYTGILALFSNLARKGHSLRVFEDGHESRDFVYIDDAVRATATCVTATLSGINTYNVGSGIRTNMLELAIQVNAFYGGHSSVEVTGSFREGDIRHGMGDIALARSSLGYEPRWEFLKGLRSFLESTAQADSGPVVEGYERSLVEMTEKGLLHGRK